jgi:hypothetical protein
MTFDPIAAWGAGLATALGALRMYEFWRDRGPRLRTSFIWRGHPEAGNDVLFINDSKVPAAIYGLNLVWADPRMLAAPVERRTIFDLEDDFADIAVPAHGIKRLSFAEAEHFSHQRPRDLPNSRLYAKLWLVGRRKPLWLKIGDA